MILTWTTAAKTDRKEIFSYIAKDNLQAAIKLDNHLAKVAEMLIDNPKLGKQGRIPETREILTKGTYHLVYEIHTEHIWITAVVHTSREWPNTML